MGVGEGGRKRDGGRGGEGSEREKWVKGKRERIGERKGEKRERGEGGGEREEGGKK